MLFGKLDPDMKKIMYKISQQSDFVIEVMETDKDHINMMISSTPKLSESGRCTNNC